MATAKQTQAAKRNVKKAQKAATGKQTIAHLPQEARPARPLEDGPRRARQEAGRAVADLS
jgi:hypothetical protein